MANMQPAPMTFTLATPPVSAGATGEFTCDLSQIASIVNRRFYRQGLNWAVAGIKVYSTVTGALRVNKIPNTWVTSNAWEKTFRAWNKQQMNAIEEAGAESAVARFRDYKVFMDPLHYQAGPGANLLPIDSLNNTALTGEWSYSQIVLPNADLDPVSGARTEPRETFLHMVGANEVVSGGVSSRGILEGYADSRAFPQSPDPVSPDIDSGNNWLRAMFDVGNDNEDITENATDKNQNLPYDQVNYPGGQTNMPGLQVHDTVQLVSFSPGSGNIGTKHIKGGNFPCGLVRLQWIPTDTTANVVIEINMVPGSHRGYLAEPMTEM